jgi:hypothetical protein
MHDDMIDFPCSYDWLDHYHSRGLTPRSSGRADPVVKELLKEIAELRKSQVEMQEILLEVVRELKKLKASQRGEKQSSIKKPQKFTQSALRELEEG